MSASALYHGAVVHRRFRPRRHDLRYRLFLMAIDLDELDRLGARLRLFSRNRFNLFAFHDRDHGDGSGAPLRPQVERLLDAAGVEIAGGPIRLLCLPRILGYVFNPLSVYFCHRRDGGLAALLYEVNNTFGQRHTYVIPAAAGRGPVRQACAKRFHVSPFLDMAMSYDFRVVPPDDTVSVAIRGSDAGGLLIAAAFAGRRGPLTDRALARTAVAYPFLTLKVIAAIHWEALRLWLKGMSFRRCPPPPETAATIAAEPR